MKGSIYTKTALASLLTLYSFGSFATDGEVKKPEASTEVMKTSNKKLKQKMDRICNVDPQKKAKEDEARRKALESKKLEEEAKQKALKAKKLEQEDSKQKALEAKKQQNEEARKKLDEEKNKKDEMRKAENEKRAQEKARIAEDAKAQLKPQVNKNVKDISKDTTTEMNFRGVKITFGGVVDAQGYGKFGSSEASYKRFNTSSGRAVEYYSASEDQIKGNNPLFPEGIGNVGDYSQNVGALADAILHLRAENQNEDLSLSYGADLQFYVPVTKGKGASQGVVATRNRGAHVFVNSQYGDVKFGYQFGPEALMRLDATRIATVDGAADSDWFRKVNLEGKAASFPFYVTPRLYTESFSSESEKLAFRMAEKHNKAIINTLPFRVAYYSPNYMGLRFGLSYSPGYESKLFSTEEQMTNTKISYDKKINQIIDSLAHKLKFKDNSDLAMIGVMRGGSGYSEDFKKVLTSDIDQIKAFKDIPRGDIGLIVERVISPNANTFTIEDGNTKQISEYIDDLGPINTTTGKAKQTQLNALREKARSEIEKKVKGNKVTFDDLATALSSVFKEMEKNFDTDSKINIRNEVTKLISTPVAVEAFLESDGQKHNSHVGPGYEHIISAGVSYEYNLEEYKLNIKAAAAGEYGQAKKADNEKHRYNELIEYNDLLGGNVGISAHYKIDDDQSAQFAASFAYLGKSGQPKAIKTFDSLTRKYVDSSDKIRTAGLEQFQHDTMYWTVGAGYQYEKVYTSLTYFGSKMNGEEGDKLHDIALGVQYDLSPTGSKSKFVPYAALHVFFTEEKGNNIVLLDKTSNVPNNKGALLLTGVKFNF